MPSPPTVRRLYTDASLHAPVPSCGIYGPMGRLLPVLHIHVRGGGDRTRRLPKYFSYFCIPRASRACVRCPNCAVPVNLPLSVSCWV